MVRYRLTLEYDGSGFAGWQYQVDHTSVQGVLEKAIFKLASAHAVVQGAGRTDAGVHALAQVAHVDLERDWDTFTLLSALNFHVRPHAVSILQVEKVPETFEARFSAVQRHYLYRILNRRAPPSLERNQVWHVPTVLDVEAMAEGARHLIGHHDFSTFRAAQCQANSPVRTLERFHVERDGDIILFQVSARSFLHRQVRSMVGSLREVGEGKWTSRMMADILAARDRTHCGPVAPPQGLYLTGIDYPDPENYGRSVRKSDQSEH